MINVRVIHRTKKKEVLGHLPAIPSVGDWVRMDHTSVTKNVVEEIIYTVDRDFVTIIVS